MSWAIGVSAMLMTVESSMSTNRPMQVPTSVHQRRLASVSPGTAGRRAAGAATATSSRVGRGQVFLCHTGLRCGKERLDPLPCPLAQLLGVLDRDLARALQDVEQELQLGHRVTLELDLPAFLQRAVDVPRHLHRLVGELDDDAAAVGGIGPAAHPAALLEPVDHRGHGAGGQAAGAGQVAGRDRGALERGRVARAAEEVEHAHVGAVEPEHVAHGSVVVLELGLHGPELEADVVQHVIARTS